MFLFVSVLPDLTFVLTGERNAIDFGPRNILFDHDEERNAEQFSSKLYDLCGRHISVINILGLQNIDKIPLNQGIHAFLLLVPYGRHSSHYTSGVQWLEKAFGKGSLPYVMTVVTQWPGEKYESALADLKASSRFSEKRCHTCTRGMMDANEIIDLLEKIDVMVSENDYHCYSRLKHEEHEELDQKEEMVKRGEILICGGLILTLYESLGSKGCIFVFNYLNIWML